MAIIANDAATMLAEALEKMDGLISDDQMMMEGLKPATLSFSPTDHILSLAEDLRNALISVVPSNRQNLRIPKQTAEFLSSWLKSLLDHNDCDQKSGIYSNGEISRAQIERLEDEKDSLILQVSVLTDQVEAQGEKMRELEFTLEEQRIKAEDLEQELKKETAKSASFDKEREKLLAENSSLKLAADEPNHSSMSSGKESPKTIEEYEKKLAEKDSEIELLKDHIEVLLDEQETLQRTLGDGHASSGLKSQLREKASEVNKLKLQVETLTAVVEDKDNKLKELQGIVSKFKRVEDLVVRAHQRKGSEASQSAATELSLPDSNSVHSSDGILSPVPTSTLSDSAVESSSPSPTPHHLHQESYVQAVNNPVTPSLKAVKNPKQANKPHTGIRSSFGKGFFKTKGPKSSSESNISQVERSADGKNGAIPQNKVESQVPQVPHEQTSPESQRKEKKSIGKTINKAFGKLRRTKSLGDNQDNRINLPPLDFKNQNKVERPDYGDQLELPFCNWSTEMIMNWLDDLGLGCYTEGCRQNVTCGEDLIRASGPEIDKLLGIRHPLHRKKLQLALQALVSDSPDIMGRLSNHWVLGWLEDIGLPHYKDAFSDACVDGRMLNYLTLDDLQQLKVTNALHHVSIQRAIQCLRFNNFHPNSLKRYPIDESWQKGADVLLWTNGRVVEWLRLVDLAEYAPNLRGNGVHGALMILEPRFTAETLAALLSIPTTKSLLRRHLASHFQSLVGPACYSLKEQAAKLPTFTPLMPDTKQKVIKKSKSLGSLRGKKGAGSELDNYVCPMDFDIPQELKPTVTRSRRKSDEEFSRTRRRDSDEFIDSKQTTAIGAFSKELDSLTHMLDHDGHAQKMAAHL